MHVRAIVRGLRRLLVGVWLVAAPAWANDFSFGGAGADLVPLEETRVQMVSEDIRLEYGLDPDTNRRFREQWKVKAQYVFKNTSQKAVTLQVGFPELRCDQEYDCPEGWNEFQNLRTLVDGVEVQHRQGTLSKQHEWQPFLGVIWLYQITFPAGHQVKVEHTYTVNASNNGIYSWVAGYVTRTGAKWAGTITRARFTFILPVSAHSVGPPKAIPMKSLRLIEPDGPHPHVEVVCEQTNWEPTKDVWLEFNDTQFILENRLGQRALDRSGIRKEDLCPLRPWSSKFDLTPAQHQMCVNDFLALGGSPFEDQKVASYYYGDPFDWREEKYPHDEHTWWARSLRPLAQFQRSWADQRPLDWLERHPPVVNAQPDQAATTPAVVSSAASQVQMTVSAAPASAPTAESRSKPAAPPPARPREGSCGCGMANSAGMPLSSMILLVALARRRWRNQAGN
jgi:hypothetical protein